MEKISDYKIVLEIDDDNMMSLEFLQDGELIEDFTTLDDTDINKFRNMIYNAGMFLNKFTK